MKSIKEGTIFQKIVAKFAIFRPLNKLPVATDKNLKRGNNLYCQYSNASKWFSERKAFLIQKLKPFLETICGGSGTLYGFILHDEIWHAALKMFNIELGEVSKNQIS